MRLGLAQRMFLRKVSAQLILINFRILTLAGMNASKRCGQVILMLFKWYCSRQACQRKYGEDGCLVKSVHCCLAEDRARE